MSDISNTDADALDFLDKLGKFHSTLPPSQQLMLDELTATALQAPEVEGFSLPGATPNFPAQGSLPPIPVLRQTLLGQATNPQVGYYHYYDSVAKLL